MINETIIAFSQAVIRPEIPWWVSILAIIGAMAVFSTACKYVADLIGLVAYLIGLIRFIYLKAKKRDV